MLFELSELWINLYENTAPKSHHNGLVRCFLIMERLRRATKKTAPCQVRFA